MESNIQIDNDQLTRLIDVVGPLNNIYRTSTNPIEQIEVLWEIGEILDSYMNKYDLTLHELLYMIYDPYSTVKKSYITRDLGSYSYRIYKYYPKKSEIQDKLQGLQSYSVFREAIPLLFNESYGLNKNQKEKIYEMITSSDEHIEIKERLKEIKKDIKPIKNPRDQRSDEFEIQSSYLNSVFDDLQLIYRENETFPSETNFLDTSQKRANMVKLLMALSSEIFISKLEEINEVILDQNQKKLLEIAQSDNSARSRFRKWVMSSNALLKMAEAIQNLDKEYNYPSYRDKFLEEDLELGL